MKFTVQSQGTVMCTILKLIGQPTPLTNPHNAKSFVKSMDEDSDTEPPYNPRPKKNSITF